MCDDFSHAMMCIGDSQIPSFVRDPWPIAETQVDMPVEEGVRLA
jgi:hypothetical protein